MAKNRFRCLSGARQLNFSPEKVSAIVNVCCALHNICFVYQVQIDDYLDAHLTELNEVTYEDDPTPTNLRNEAITIRNNVMNSL